MRRITQIQKRKWKRRKSLSLKHLQNSLQILIQAWVTEKYLKAREVSSGKFNCRRERDHLSQNHQPQNQSRQRKQYQKRQRNKIFQKSMMYKLMICKIWRVTLPAVFKIVILKKRKTWRTELMKLPRSFFNKFLMTSKMTPKSKW